MEIKDIIKKIPSIIGSLFKDIYCIDKKNNEVYIIDYTGDELKVSVPLTIKEFISKINNEKISSLIEDNTDISKIIDNTYIRIKVIEHYKIVLNMNLEEEDKGEEKEKMLLIADDSPVITKFFTKIFKDEYKVLVAKDGEEAIKLIEDNINNNLLGAFIDLQMPVKSGYDVLEYCKEKDLFKKVPISVISGEDTEDGIKKTMAYDIVDMLQKPFSREAAKAIVSKTISFSNKEE